MEDRDYKVVVVEDDPRILLGVKENLELEGYEVLTAKDGEKGEELALEEDPDLVILDVMLPRKNGFEILKELHQQRIRGSVIMLTARGEEQDKLEGFDRGADDYITKPFSLPEFLARVKAVLRRTDPPPERTRFSFRNIVVDYEAYEVHQDGEQLALTPREFRLLKFLCENEGKVVSRNEILDKVWGYDSYPTTRTVDNHIVKLRKQIEINSSRPRHIVSIRGVGYKFLANPED